MNNFLLEDPNELPFDGKYFFNVDVYTLGRTKEEMRKLYGDEVTTYAITQYLTDPRPWMVYVYENEENIREIFVNCVVEVSETYGVSWWRGEQIV